MKILTMLAVSVALTAGSLQVQASEQAERDLQQCLSELRGIYGQDSQLHLVDRRRNEHGTRMRVAARLDADNSYFANCWVARYDEGDIDYASERQDLAVIDLVAAEH